MALELVTAATTMPVSLADAKLWCGVEDASFDALLTQLLAAACARVGEITGQPMGAAEWRLWLDEFSDAIELPRSPVSAVASVQYVDTAGLTQTASAGLYTLDTVSRPAWVVLNEDESWPDTLDRVNAVSVNFTAGWTAATLPDDIKAAVCALTVYWYENRGALDVPAGVLAMLFPHRRLVI